MVYSCIQHLWRTFPIYSEQLLPSLPIDIFYDEEIVATTLALASRLFSIQRKESKKRLKSMIEPSKSTECTSCGPKRPKFPDPDSDSIATGYISISPSPSELAMPNAPLTTGNLEAVDYGALFNEVKFGSVVVVRESLLPFFVMVGVSVDPQLRVVCHNSAEYFADFTVELREAAIFVAESASSASNQTSITVQYSNNPVLLAEQLVVNGRLKYSSESSLQKSPHLSLLARSSRTAEVLQQSTTSKLNISSNCSVSLDSITTNITLPLLKLGRHMIETRKLRSSWRNKFRREMPEPEDIVVSKAPNLVPPQPPTAWPTDSDMPDFGQVPAPPQIVNIWKFSQGLVQQLSQLEQENVPQLTETLQKVEPRAESEPLSTQPGPSSSPLSSKPIKISSYLHSPRYPRAHISPLSEGKSPTSKVSLQVAPTVDLPSDSSESGGGIHTPGKHFDRRHKRALSSTSNVSGMSGEAVAICIEDTDSRAQLDGVFLMSPDEHTPALDTYGGDVEDTTDSQHVMSSDEVVSSTPTHKTFVDPSVLARNTRGTMRFAVVPGMSDHTYPLVKSLKLTETELLFTVFGLLKINRIHFDLQVETTRASLELCGISASVDTRKAATTSQSFTSMAGSLPQMDSQSTAEESGSQTQSKSEVLPTYLSIAATLKKSCLRVSDRGLPDSDLVLFSALPIYCSLGICNSSLQPVPTYRCLLKLSGIELDVKQSPVKMHKRFQHLMPAFTKIYNEVFAPIPRDMAEPGIFQQPTTPSAPVVNIPEVKMPAKLPQGLVHLSLDKATMLMAPLSSLSVTYSVSRGYWVACMFLETFSELRHL